MRGWGVGVIGRGFAAARSTVVAALAALTVAAMAALAMGGAARAADLPVAGPAYYPAAPRPVPYYDWTGVYLGLNAGWAWATQNTIITTDVPTGGFVSLTSGSSNGFAGGGQVGANWFIAPSYLIGVVADFDATTAHNSTTSADGTNRHDNRLKYISTARARFGLTADRFLVYTTGGFAFGETEVTRTQQTGAANAATAGTVETISNTRLGWAVGGGTEYAVLSNVTVFGEYIYTRLNGVTYTFPLAQRLSTTSFEGVNQVRFGVNVKFGGGDAYIGR
jgi:outer membrane immunogenic protein